VRSRGGGTPAPRGGSFAGGSCARAVPESIRCRGGALSGFGALPSTRNGRGSASEWLGPSAVPRWASGTNATGSGELSMKGASGGADGGVGAGRGRGYGYGARPRVAEERALVARREGDVATRHGLGQRVQPVTLELCPLTAREPGLAEHHLPRGPDLDARAQRGEALDRKHGAMVPRRGALALGQQGRGGRVAFRFPGRTSRRSVGCADRRPRGGGARAGRGPERRRRGDERGDARGPRRGRRAPRPACLLHLGTDGGRGRAPRELPWDRSRWGEGSMAGPGSPPDGCATARPISCQSRPCPSSSAAVHRPTGGARRALQGRVLLVP
jgi:hypothetical protein